MAVDDKRADALDERPHWTEVSRHITMEYPATIPHMLRHVVARFGDNDCIVSGQTRHSYRDLDKASRALAKHLIALGVGKGSRIGILFPQTADWVIAFLAAARVGALVMPFSSFYKPAELHRALQHGDVAMLIIPPQMFGRDMTAFVADAVPGLSALSTPDIRLADVPYLRSVIVYGAGEAPSWARPVGPVTPDPVDVSDGLLDAMEEAISPADLVVMISTSGTTSLPKGVVHSHGAQVRHSLQLTMMTRLSERDRVFAGMPFFWVGGLTATLLPVMHAGGIVLCQERFEAGDALDILEGQKATRMIAWPTLRQRLQSHPSFPQRDLSSVAAFPSTGETRHGSLGMTETSGPHTHPPIAELGRVLPDELKGSFGASIPFVEHRIADPVTNETLVPGETGELCVRGYSLMQGIYKQEREETFDTDGWYHTGDRGYFKQGYFFFEGRSSEMIKSAGSNVSPREVESEMEALPGIASSWVFGVADADRGEAVVAGILVHSPVDIGAIRATLHERLSSYKVPQQIVLLAEHEIPLLATGKADRRAVREIVKAKLTQ